MVEKTKDECVRWEDDQDDEVHVGKIVVAPNKKRYRIRALSVVENTKISDICTKYINKMSRGRRGMAEMEFKMDTSKLQALTLQKAVTEPDFSKHSVDEITTWMSKKASTVNFLLDEVSKLSGFPETESEQG